jgi:hypothetical protein
LADCGLLGDRRYADQLRKYQVALCQFAHDEWNAIYQYELENQGKSPGPWHKHRQKPIPAFVYTPPRPGIMCAPPPSMGASWRGWRCCSSC